MSLGMMGIGTALGASAAGRAKDQLLAIANTPGLNLSQQVGEASGLMPDIQALESQRNQFNQAELERLLERSIPGYREAQAQRTGTSMSLMRGELPPDVEEAVFRRSAGRAVGGGFAGSLAGRNLTARDLGRTSLDLMNLGQQQFAGILGTTPRAQAVDYAFTPQDITGLRSGERTQRMQALQSWAGAPSSGAVWGQGLQQMGKSLMELAGSVGGMAAGGGICWVARAVYGADNPRWRIFRHWLLEDAPKWLLKAYKRHGRWVAAFIADKPRLQAVIRRWMDVAVDWKIQQMQQEIFA